jgi:HEPN domain-containing protein
VPPFFEDIVFHAQQAAEKTFKAFLAWHERAFRKTHSIEELGEQCIGIEPDLKAIVDLAVPLTAYAWMFRYPGEPEAPTREGRRCRTRFCTRVGLSTPHKPELVAETRAWLVRTERDLTAAAYELRHDHHSSKASCSTPVNTGELFEAILARLPEEVRP